MAIKPKVKLEDQADALGVSPEDLVGDAFADEDYASVEVEIDFEAGSVRAYPNGTYHARLEAVEKKVASTGNSMLVWRFRTLQDRRAFWCNTVLTKDAMWKVTETVVACGAKGEGKTKVNVGSLIGNVCRIVIQNEVYEGENRPGIKKVLAPTEETFKVSDLG